MIVHIPSGLMEKNAGTNPSIDVQSGKVHTSKAKRSAYANSKDGTMQRFLIQYMDLKQIELFLNAFRPF